MWQQSMKIVLIRVMKPSAGCLKVIVLVWLTLFGEVLFADNLGVFGSLYEIVEQDALLWIKQKLEALNASGEMAVMQEKMKEKTLLSIKRPKPVPRLRRTTLPRNFTKDLTVDLPEDIYDIDGKVIYKAHQKVNPLTQMQTKKALIFIDGDDLNQVSWALKQLEDRSGLAKLVLVNGPVIDLMETHRVQFFFDQFGRLVDYFKIEQVPAIVRQEADHLLISEVLL